MGLRGIGEGSGGQRVVVCFGGEGGGEGGGGEGEEEHVQAAEGGGGGWGGHFFGLSFGGGGGWVVLEEEGGLMRMTVFGRGGEIWEGQREGDKKGETMYEILSWVVASHGNWDDDDPFGGWSFFLY